MATWRANIGRRQEAFQDAVDALKLQPSLARAHAARGGQRGNVMGRKVGNQQTNRHDKHGNVSFISFAFICNDQNQ